MDKFSELLQTMLNGHIFLKFAWIRSILRSESTTFRRQTDRAGGQQLCVERLCRARRECAGWLGPRFRRQELLLSA